MPKVLIIVNRFNIGGQVSNAAIIAKYLPNDYETLIIGGDIEPGEDSSIYWLEELNIKPLIIKEMKREINYKQDKIALRRVKKIIEDFKPDVVHTHAAKAGAIGRMAAKQMAVAVIIHTYHGHVFHSYFGKLKTAFYKNVERYLARKSSKIIVLSKEQQHEISEVHKICPKNKTEIIPLGFDFAKFQINQEEKRRSFREAYNISDDIVCVGIIGRLTAIKNHHFFINVVDKTIQSNLKEKVKFFIIGDGELMTELQNYCAKKNIAIETPNKKNENASIVFTSWIKEVDWALAGLDIVTLTSKNEGTPVTLIEAQAAERSIVSTNVGGIKDVIIENETGFLANKGDIDTFVSKLVELIKNKTLREEMGLKGRNNAEKSFSYRRLINDIDLLYKKLLQEKFGN